MVVILVLPRRLNVQLKVVFPHASDERELVLHSDSTGLANAPDITSKTCEEESKECALDCF